MWDPEAADKRLANAINGADADVLVADLDGAIGGICTVYYDIDSVRFGRRAWVEDLAVDPDQRSRGIGKALLDAAKDWGASAVPRTWSSTRRWSERTRTGSTNASSRPGDRSVSVGSSEAVAR